MKKKLKIVLRKLPFKGSFLMLFSLFPGIVSSKQIILTKEQCLQLVNETITHADVTYQPGIDTQGRPVPSADLGGGIKIKTPEMVTLPVEIDIRRYLKPQDTTTFQNHETLNQIQNRIDQEKSKVVAEEKNIQNTLLQLKEGNEELKRRTSENPADPEISEGLESLFRAITDTTSRLEKQTHSLIETAPLLQKSTSVLEKTFSEFENNPSVLQRNNEFYNKTLKSSNTATNSILQSRENVTVLSNHLTQAASTLATVDNALSEETKIALSSQLTSTTKALDKIKSSMTSLVPTDTTLKDINKSLAKLGITSQKNVFVEKASLGTVTIHMDGRAYFNGQPLFDKEQQALKKACQRILNQ
tara:strand:- start:927 stop:2000 length:1074 start_codon:yes stop_codon:yes gene_type:complete